MAIRDGIWLCVILFVALPAPSLATNIVTDIIDRCDGATGRSDNCSLVGNGDYYGLGVRFGIYFSWAASWLDNNFVVDDTCQSLDTNAIFLTAIAITVGYYSTSYKIRVIDALILLQLCFGYLLSVMSLWGYRTKVYGDDIPMNRRQFGGWGTHFRLILMCAITAYGVWFWSWGMPVFLPRCNLRQECGGLKLWLLGERKVADPAIRGVNLAFSAICGAFYFTMFLVAAVAALRIVMEMIVFKKLRWTLQEEIEKNEPLPSKLPLMLRIFVSLVNLLWIVFSIVTIEYTLSYNHVKGERVQQIVASAGQLIPLVTGGITLARVLVRILLQIFHHYFPESDKDGSNGRMGASRPSSRSSSVSSATYYANRAKQRRRYWVFITALIPWLCVFKSWTRRGRR